MASRCRLAGCEKAVLAGTPYCSPVHAQVGSTLANCKRRGCSKSARKDGPKTYDYCGRTCAQRATAPADGKVCRLGGCRMPAKESFDYCGIKHGTLGKTLPNCSAPCCLKTIYVDPSGTRHPFCSRSCSDRVSPPSASLASEFLAEVSPIKFAEIQKQFLDTWHPAHGAPGVVEAVYKVHQTDGVNTRFRARQESTQAEMVAMKVPSHKLGSLGNTNRRFHGTKVTCNLGLNGNKTLCSAADCSGCQIIRSGFCIFPGSRFGWSRFGRGLYFTSASSKSHSYNDGSEKVVGSKKYRVTLLASVVCGRGLKLLHDDRARTTAGSDDIGPFHSVLGEVGGVLNHDEVVVYTEDAAKVAYLIVYSHT